LTTSAVAGTAVRIRRARAVSSRKGARQTDRNAHAAVFVVPDVL